MVDGTEVTMADMRFALERAVTDLQQQMANNETLLRRVEELQRENATLRAKLDAGRVC